MVKRNNGRLGSKQSEETKRKIGNSVRGQKRTIETRRNISNALKGKKKSKQHRENLSKSKMKSGIGVYRREWEKIHGKVPKGFVLHHLDENRRNNRPENLTLMRRDYHSKLHGCGKR